MDAAQCALEHTCHCRDYRRMDEACIAMTKARVEPERARKRDCDAPVPQICFDNGASCVFGLLPYLAGEMGVVAASG